MFSLIPGEQSSAVLALFADQRKTSEYFATVYDIA